MFACPEIVTSDRSVSLYAATCMLQRLRRISEQKAHEISLRVAVEGGGCSGFQYKFTLDSNSGGADDRCTFASPFSSLQSLPTCTSSPARSFALLCLRLLFASPITSLKLRVFEQSGVKVIVDTASLELLQGAQIDYAESMISSSFQVVSNPNSETSCSCGTSFVAKA